MKSLERYRTDPPEGESGGRCLRHPEEIRVYAEIPVRDITQDEQPAVVRGWTCRRCWTARGVALDGGRLR